MVLPEKLLTLEDVIKEVQSQLQFLPEKEAEYRTFLERQQAQHPEYDINHRKKVVNRSQPFYFNLLVDMLLLYARLHGDYPVREEVYTDKETLIDSFEKLPLLRPRGGHRESWPDTRLYLIYERRETGRTRHALPGYHSLLDEIGGDSGIVAVWERPLRYQQDMAITSRGKKKNTPTRI